MNMSVKEAEFTRRGCISLLFRTGVQEAGGHIVLDVTKNGNNIGEYIFENRQEN